MSFDQSSMGSVDQRGNPGPVSAAGRPSKSVLALVIGTIVVVVLGAIASLISLPYVILSPGPATNILGEVDGEPVLSVTGAPTYPTGGSLDFTTVRIAGGPGDSVNVFDVVGAWISPSSEVDPVDWYFAPDETAEDTEAEGEVQMTASQTTAAATAVRALGQEVPIEVSIGQVPDDSPSRGIFEPGDIIVSVDGVPADDAEAVRSAIRSHEPGDEVPMVISRGGEQREVLAKTGKDDGPTYIGVFLQTDYDLPVDVSLNTGRVGGPSAGLMFSLAIYDALTPGELTGGEQIAGTGTIDDSGEVGPIGGIRQKLVGARDAGAEWFLAPTLDCPETVGHVPDGLTVLQITTFDDALAAVEGIAAGTTEGLPRCDS